MREVLLFLPIAIQYPPGGGWNVLLSRLPRGLRRPRGRRRTALAHEPSRMSTEPAHTELILHEDTRFFGAIGAVVQHASQRCGLSETGQQGLTAAGQEAGSRKFPLLEGHGYGESPG